MYQFNKVPDESHNGESDGDRFRDLDVLCQHTWSTRLVQKTNFSPIHSKEGNKDKG
jgi:hypothetical protein